MPLLPVTEPAVFPHPRLLLVAIRREILAVLATSREVTVPSATAHVAARWTARRRRLGESPSVVQTTQAIVCQVGADLVDELAADQRPDEPVAHTSSRATSGRGRRGAAVAPNEEGSMSDFVTWELCTRCGLLAALGWAGVPGKADHVLPVEFDCPTGCRPDHDELVAAYSLASTSQAPERGVTTGDPVESDHGTGRSTGS